MTKDIKKELMKHIVIEPRTTSMLALMGKINYYTALAKLWELDKEEKITHFDFHGNHYWKKKEATI
jgi:hypothetical protein